MPLPSEDEIRSFAEKIGALDDDGNYTVSRSKLAAGAQKYREELAKEAEAEQVETTAQKLGRFLAEVQSELRGPTGRTAAGLPIAGVDADSFLAAVAPALIRREGLILNPKENPHP